MKIFCHKLFCFAALFAVVLLLTGCGEDGGKRNQEKVTVNFIGPEGMQMSYNGKPMSGLKRRLPVGTFVFKFTAPGFKPAWQQIIINENSRDQNEEIDMIPEKGALVIKSFIAGRRDDQRAKVFCDGKEYGLTPCLITGLPLKKYEIKLELQGYAPVTEICELSPEQPMLEIRKELASTNSVLQVKGTPAGATLVIGDEVVGTIPWRGTRPAGRCLLKLRAAGYVPFSKEVVLSPGKVHQFNYDLTPAPSTLEVESEPANAVCYFNGEKKGTTPLKIENITPRKRYRIRLEYPGFDPVEKLVEVKPQSREKLKFVLETAFGSARLNIRPAGVDVFVDGKLLQKTAADPDRPGETLPIMLKNLKPGKHTVRVYHRYGRTRSGKDFIREFIVYKNQVTDCPAMELWVANADITFDNGETSRVKIIRQTADTVEFSPIVGVSVSESTAKIKKIKMLDE